MTFAGGSIGVAGRITLSLVASRIVGWNVTALPTGVVLTLSSSLIVGSTSSTLPAISPTRSRRCPETRVGDSTSPSGWDLKANKDA